MRTNNKLLLLLLICVFAVFLPGCGSINFNIEDTIQPPENNKESIQGTWKIQNYISAAEGQDKAETERKLKPYLGKEAVFDNEIGAVGRDVCINPKYRIITTFADTFIQSKYRISEDRLGLKKEKINVVTIVSDDRTFYDVIVTDKNMAFAYLENGFLMLNKISDSVDQKVKESSFGNVGMSMDNGEFKEDPLLRSGVLIGIRSAEDKYRTVWIQSVNRKIKTVGYRKQLLVPRNKGFWEIGTLKNADSGESIYAEPFADAASQTGNKNNILSDMPDSKIQFVGNDYIGIEHNLELKVFPIDNIRSRQGVAFSEIVSGNSYGIFEQAADAFILTQNNGNSKNIVKPDEENFTLTRQNGHWIIKGRLFYKQPSENKVYEDFNINMMVPQKLIFYDEMSIPWNDIKSRLPWITDAYMSPNKDIAILVSEDFLYIYPVQNKNIINKQIMEIPLSKADSIVMTEWCIGKYADIWGDFADKIFTDQQ